MIKEEQPLNIQAPSNDFSYSIAANKPNQLTFTQRLRANYQNHQAYYNSGTTGSNDSTQSPNSPQKKIKENIYKSLKKVHSVLEKPLKLPQEAYIGLQDKLQVEGSRKYRATVFDQAAWTDHRKQTRYWNYASTIFGSRILFSIWQPVLLITITAVLLGLFQKFRVKVLPAWFPSLIFTTTEPLTVTSFALSLLLVFRTNNCFQRYFEARLLWGTLTNRSRDVNRMVNSYFPKDKVMAKYTFIRWSAAFPRILLWHLRSESDLADDIKHIIQPEELKYLMSCQHKPTAAIQIISEIVNQSLPEGWQNYQIQSNVTILHDVLGACERILRTPMPLSYTKHTCRFLLVWLLLLPFNLWPRMSWSTVPITLVTALLLLGIDEIAIQIEEPFGVLPLDAQAERIERDIMMMYQKQLDVKHLVQKSLNSKDSYRDSLAYDLEKERFEMDIAIQRGSWQEDDVDLQIFIERTHKQIPKQWEGQAADFWKRDLPRDCW